MKQGLIQAGNPTGGQAGACVPDLPRTRGGLGAGWLLLLPLRPPAANEGATISAESHESVPATHAPSSHSAVKISLAPH